MPAYNAAKYISQTIDSILAQTYRYWELIVVNDGSTDATLSLLNNINHPQIRVITSANRGASAARNLAFQLAKGEYVLFFDADDLMPPEFLSSQLAAMGNNINSVVVSRWGRFYDNNPATFELVEMDAATDNFRDWIKYYWYNVNPMTNPGRILIPRNIAELAGPWNENLSLNDDLEYFTRIFLSVKKIIFNPETSLLYNSGVGGLSSTQGIQAAQSLFDALQMSIDRVLATYPGDDVVQKSCANMWQNVVYQLYPRHMLLAKRAATRVKDLHGSYFPFPAGGMSRIVCTLFGWKVTKRLQIWLSQFK